MQTVGRNPIVRPAIVIGSALTVIRPPHWVHRSIPCARVTISTPFRVAEPLQRPSAHPCLAAGSPAAVQPASASRLGAPPKAIRQHCAAAGNTQLSPYSTASLSDNANDGDNNEPLSPPIRYGITHSRRIIVLLVISIGIL